MADRTLVLLKPDAVERGLVGEIVSRFERKDLRVVAMDLRRLDEATLAALATAPAAVGGVPSRPPWPCWVR